MPFLIPVNTEMLCAHAHPSTLHTALFPLALKTTSKHTDVILYIVVVGTDTLLHKQKKV